MKKLIMGALAVLLLGCAAKAPERAAGWTASTAHAETTTRMFLYGPTADVEAIIAQSRPLGWRSVEQSVAPSGFKFALMESRVNVQTESGLVEIVGTRPVTVGPAFRLVQ